MKLSNPYHALQLSLFLDLLSITKKNYASEIRIKLGRFTQKGEPKTAAGTGEHPVWRRAPQSAPAAQHPGQPLAGAQPPPVTGPPLTEAAHGSALCQQYSPKA